MTKIIFDTSVWVDYVNGKVNLQTDLLDKYLMEGGRNIFLCPIIVQEVLQGFKFDEQYYKFKSSFLSHSLLTINHQNSAIGAAEIYRNLRKKGITIRKINDCMIAFYALFYDLEICHNDSDFDQIAKVYPLKITK